MRDDTDESSTSTALPEIRTFPPGAAPEVVASTAVFPLRVTVPLVEASVISAAESPTFVEPTVVLTATSCSVSHR